MGLICKHVEALHGYTPGEQPRFEGMVKLNTNENPYPPSPKVGEALAQVDWQKLRLYPDPVCQNVRQQIAQNLKCDVEQIFVGNGSDEILALFTRAFVEVGGTIGYFDPTYSLYSVLAAIRDAKVKPLPLNEDFTCPVPSSDFSDAFIWTNPNAPTSIMVNPETIITFAKSFSGTLLIDEAYADFAPANCISWAQNPENQNTLVMRTLSKSFSLAGVRFGYCVGPKPLIDALYKIKDSYNMDALAQVIGLAALGDLPYMQANARTICETRAFLAQQLQSRGWQVLPSATNFLFAQPPVEAQALFNALREEHIYVRYFPGEKTGNYLRITIGTPQEVARLLEVLSRYHA
ncbi:MAG: histidinol-phosphate transaminase [Kiritimatiellae bacterium]|nr:histidinol-phosphate transaminase [Kiritimatiellia bacterium]